MNLGIPQCKNYWKWGHATFSCRIQGSKCIKCNGPHKSENHCKFRWCCKTNEKMNPPRLETKKGELCPHTFKCSNYQGDHQANSNQYPFWRHQFNRVAAKEIHRDPWKQDHIKSFYGEQQTPTMILQNLRIFSQNVHKNHLIINTILETQTYFDIILIQEPPWSIIRKAPSISNSKGKDLIGTVHYPNWLLFTCISVNRSNSSRVSAYINICLSSLHFTLCSDIISHRDILLISFLNNHMCYYIMNVYSNSSHMALKYLKNTEVNIDNIIVMTGDFNIRDSLWDSSFSHHSY